MNNETPKPLPMVSSEPAPPAVAPRYFQALPWKVTNVRTGEEATHPAPVLSTCPACGRDVNAYDGKLCRHGVLLEGNEAGSRVAVEFNCKGSGQAPA